MNTAEMANWDQKEAALRELLTGSQDRAKWSLKVAIKILQSIDEDTIGSRPTAQGVREVCTMLGAAKVGFWAAEQIEENEESP